MLESLVTTRNEDGTINVAPMGVETPRDSWSPGAKFLLRPFHTSRTHTNLARGREAVIHVTDDVLLLARATVGSPIVPMVDSQSVSVPRLLDCCRAFECVIQTPSDVESLGPDRSRYRATVAVVHDVRPFFGFNRAKWAVVETAILASRVGLLSPDHLAEECERLLPLIEKTGGPAEREAFHLLCDHIRARAV